MEQALPWAGWLAEDFLEEEEFWALLKWVWTEEETSRGRVRWEEKLGGEA